MFATANSFALLVTSNVDNKKYFTGNETNSTNHDINSTEASDNTQNI